MLRPEPGATATMAKALAAGFDARAYPLFETVALPWDAPEPHRFDALMVTSANAVRLAGPQLEGYAHLPAFAVGQATAVAVRDAGFEVMGVGEDDVQSLATAITRSGHKAVLHLCGRDVRPFKADDLHVTQLCVYAAVERGSAEDLARMLKPDMILLVHSPRAGARLAELLPVERRASLHIVAISAATLARCSVGWASVHAAEKPRDDAMLALAATLCE